MPLALITGPTSGIGHAFARALAAERYDLVLVSRDQARLDELAITLNAEFGIDCEVVVADLTERAATSRVEHRLASEPFDLVVNNAGFGLNTPFDKTDVDAEQRSLDILVGAVMRLTHAALGPMRAAGHGDIINVSSVAGFLPRGTYGASKAWVTSFSVWANGEYRRDGVRVMALCPGFVRTEFHQRMKADMSGLDAWMWLEPDPLVAAALKDLRAGKAISVPTIRYKVLATLARVSPRRVKDKVARRGRR
jgi:short-subunit dehydrogenase